MNKIKCYEVFIVRTVRTRVGSTCVDATSAEEAVEIVRREFKDALQEGDDLVAQFAHGYDEDDGEEG